jgi:glycosyltransferase involved in cell wall biosynthesis
VHILYVTADDSSNVASENNGYYLREALSCAGAEVTAINAGGLTGAEKAILGPFKLGFRAAGKNLQASLEPLVVARRARLLRRTVARVQPDLVLANAPAIVAGLDGSVPCAIYTDAPVTALIDMGHYYDRWPDRSRRRFLDVEHTALAGAARVVYHTRWAAETAARAYQLPTGKSAVVLPGANLPFVMATDSAIDKPTGDTCEILFWGRDWERKGGPFAVEVVEALHAAGAPARLTICGPDALPALYRDHPQVRFLGRVPKRSPADIARVGNLFRQTDYLLLPTNADASTSAIREGAAFGVPSVVTDVGGLGEMVSDGETGYVRHLGDPASAYVEAILHNYRNDAARLAMRANARRYYEEHLNWGTAVTSILDILSPLAAR